MSLYDYQASRNISNDAPFYSLIMAAMRRADTANLALLQAAWPEVWAELDARYNAAGGALPRGRRVRRDPGSQAAVDRPGTYRARGRDAMNPDDFPLSSFEVECDGSACGSGRHVGRHVHPPQDGHTPRSAASSCATIAASATDLPRA